MVKKRTPPRKSSPKKRVKKATRPVRKAAAKPQGGVDFRPVKRDLKAHIARLQTQLAAPEARGLTGEEETTLGKLREIDRLMSEVCQPNMVIGS